ncbi:MAG: anti-sigma factor [Opitutae bacterium]|nr:anti-sigma factor [Opitutae bacterium]
MIDERHEELAALYAVDLLDGSEKAAFEAELARHAELRALVDQLRESSASLALTARQVEPPAALKTRLLSAIEAGTARAPAAAPDSRDNVVPFPLARALPWGVAACFAVAAAFLGLRTISLRSENAALRTERQLAEVACQMAQNQLGERTLLAEKMIADLGAKLQRTEDLSRLKITALASLLGNTPEAKAIAVWDPEQQSGLLTVEKLPAIAAEQDYQIWVVDPQYAAPVDGGVFKPDSTGRATLTFKTGKPIQKAAAFAISLEKKGGVPKAEGPLVLLGKL